MATSGNPYKDYEQDIEEEKNPQSNPVDLRTVGYKGLGLLPTAGSVAGGMLGAGAGPAGSIAGAGAGEAIGRGAEIAGKKLLYDEPAPENIPKDIGEAALTGMGGEVGGQILGKFARVASKGLEESAGKSAYKSIKPYAKDVKKMTTQDMAQAGKSLLKNDIVGGFPKTYQGLADKANDVLENNLGPKYEDMINKISDNSNAVVNRSDIANKISQEVQRSPLIPRSHDEKVALSNLVDQVHGNPGLDPLTLTSKQNNLTLRQAQDLKSQLGKELEERGVWNSKKFSTLSPQDRVQIAYYHGLKDSIEEAAGKASESLGQDVSQQWKDLNFDYGNAKKAAAISQHAAGKDFVNRHISPSDYMVIAAEMASGHPATALAAGAVNHLGRKYGNQIMASTKEGLSQAAGVAASPIISRPVAQGTASLFMNKQPEQKQSANPYAE